MNKPYYKLLTVLAVNYIVMFLLTYAMIARFDHFYVNINRAYMALMMAAPMAVVMIASMRSMYTNKRWNVLLVALFGGIFLSTLALARMQATVGDRQFLRSMIPHHSSAILMCEEAAISDPRVESLCVQIIQSQKEEIAQMKALLHER